MQEVILKKTVIGGYDCFEVMNRINALQKKLNIAKKEAEKLSVLQTQADSLRAEIAQKDAEIAELAQVLEDFRVNHSEKLYAEMLAQQTDEYASSYVETARSLAESVADMTNNQISDAKNKIEILQGWLSEVNDMIGELYLSLSDLKKEYRSFNKNYRKLVNETSDTDKKKEPKKKKTAAKKTAAKKK